MLLIIAIVDVKSQLFNCPPPPVDQDGSHAADEMWNKHFILGKRTGKHSDKFLFNINLLGLIVASGCGFSPSHGQVFTEIHYVLV